MARVHKNTLGAKERMRQRANRFRWTTFRALYALAPKRTYRSDYNLTIAGAQAEKDELDRLVAARGVAPVVVAPVAVNVGGKGRAKVKAKQTGEGQRKGKGKVVESEVSIVTKVEGKGKGKKNVIEIEGESGPKSTLKLPLKSRKAKKDKIGGLLGGDILASEASAEDLSASSPVPDASRLGVGHVIEISGVTLAQFLAGQSKKFIVEMAQEVLRGYPRCSEILRGIFKPVSQ